MIKLIVNFNNSRINWIRRERRIKAYQTLQRYKKKLKPTQTIIYFEINKAPDDIYFKEYFEQLEVLQQKDYKNLRRYYYLAIVRTKRIEQLLKFYSLKKNPNKNDLHIPTYKTFKKEKLQKERINDLLEFYNSKNKKENHENN